ncbi:hypothetical protein NM208_g11692 [Fusarium decemcellulare]|uniref:Uncharacterized protein n=1 Tax=Fusarium decemcellulare TaxID=57161 RepID=A0ACC1RRM6_9HYPO|nr:hypothetical protein NM208_g11692 [Fusarium decemcellulare]
MFGLVKPDSTLGLIISSAATPKTNIIQAHFHLWPEINSSFSSTEAIKTTPSNEVAEIHHRPNERCENSKEDGTNQDPSDFKVSPNEEVSSGIFDGQDGEGYRIMGRWDTLFALITNQLGLGVLSLPASLKVLGLIPGIMTILGFGVLGWYSGIELHQFVCRYPHVANVVDMVKIVGGRPFEIVAGIGLLIQVIMTSASAAVTLSIAFNTLSQHAVCTVGFIGIACFGCWALCLPRTVKFIAKSGVPCFISIAAAALVVMISLGAGKPAKASENWTSEIKLVGNPSFRDVFNACLRIFYAYAGNITYVSYMAEMRNPARDFPVALTWLVSISVAIYLTLAISIYCLAGDFTTSPAPGSAPRTPAKVAYGIIIPAILRPVLLTGTLV